MASARWVIAAWFTAIFSVVVWNNEVKRMHAPADQIFSRAHGVASLGPITTVKAPAVVPPVARIRPADTTKRVRRAHKPVKVREVWQFDAR